MTSYSSNLEFQHTHITTTNTHKNKRQHQYVSTLFSFNSWPEPVRLFRNTSDLQGKKKITPITNSLLTPPKRETFNPQWGSRPIRSRPNPRSRYCVLLRMGNRNRPLSLIVGGMGMMGGSPHMLFFIYLFLHPLLFLRFSPLTRQSDYY